MNDQERYKNSKVTITIRRTTFEELKEKLGKDDGISWDYLLRQLLKKAGY